MDMDMKYKDTALPVEQRVEELMAQIDALVVELRDLGVTDEEIVTRIKGGNKQ